MTDILSCAADDPSALLWSPASPETLGSSGPPSPLRVLEAGEAALGSADPALARGEAAADPTAAAAGLLAQAPGFLPRLQQSVNGMLALWSVEDSLALNQLLMRTIIGQYDTFLLNALETYSDYVLEELERLVSFVGDIGDTLNVGAGLLGCSGDYVLSSVASAIFDERLAESEPSSLYEYCPQAREIAQTWDRIQAFIAEIRESLGKLTAGNGAERALDFLAETVLAGADLFAQPKVKTYVYAFYQDAARLGQLVGTIAGFLMWQVIETVVTAGIGKIKHTTKIGGALKLAAEMAV